MGDNGGGGAVPAAAAVSVEWLQKQLDSINKLPIPKKEKKKLIANAVLQMQQKQAQELGLPPPAPPRAPPRATVGQIVQPAALADGQLHSDGSTSTSLQQEQQLPQIRSSSCRRQAQHSTQGAPHVSAAPTKPKADRPAPQRG